MPFGKKLYILFAIPLIAGIAFIKSTPDKLETVITQSPSERIQTTQTGLPTPFFIPKSVPFKDAPTQVDTVLISSVKAIEREYAQSIAEEMERQEQERLAAVRRSQATTTTTLPPAPPTTSAPAPQVSGINCGGYEGIVAKYFPSEVGKACQVMACETGNTFSPTIKNSRSSASGLFQFLDGTWESTTGTPAPASAYPAETQIAAAAKLRNSSGWSPWVCA